MTDTTNTQEQLRRQISSLFYNEEKRTEEEILNQLKKIFEETPTLNLIKLEKIPIELNTILNTISSQYVFHWIWQNNYLTIAKYLLEKDAELYTTIYNNPKCAFRTVCECGHLDFVKWLLEIRPDYFNLEIIKDGFVYACKYNKVEVAKYLLQIKPDIDISAKNEEIFRTACDWGSYDVVVWLLEQKPDIYIYALQKEAFKTKNAKIEKLLNDLEDKHQQEKLERAIYNCLEKWFNKQTEKKNEILNAI
jgi:hypothetical protein